MNIMLRIRLSVGTGLLLALGPSIVQGQPPVGAAPRAGQPVSADTSVHAATAVTVPIQVVNGMPFVSATVAGHRGLFLLDCGAPTILLNREYLKPASGGGLDTVETYIEDSALSHGSGQQMPDWTTPSVTVQIGTQTIQVDQQSAVGLGGGGVFGVAVALPLPKIVEKVWGVKPLGILGFALLGQYETIIDYAHQRLTLIPVDTTGRRLAAGPAYTPRTTVPLLLEDDGGPHWFVATHLGGVLDTLEIDTGEGYDKLTPATPPRLGTHIGATGRTVLDDNQQEPVMTVDHLAFAGRSYDQIPFSLSSVRDDALGGEFFSRLGAVGFNFIARQLILYH